MTAFETNDPHGSTGDGAPPIGIVRMRVEETFSNSANPPVKLAYVRAKWFNGSARSKSDYVVKMSGNTKNVGDTFFAVRPIGGTGDNHQGKPVEWIEVSGGAQITGARRWDVLTTIDDAKTVGWTRPRFTNSP
jgi:hypothetical protein